MPNNESEQAQIAEPGGVDLAKRHTLSLLGGFGLLIVSEATGLTACTRPSAEPRRTILNTPQTTLPNLSQKEQSYRQRILELDTLTRNNRPALGRYAEEITDLAVSVFSEELGYDPNPFRGAFRFYDKAGYEVASRTETCSGDLLSENQPAHTNFFLKVINVNLDFFSNNPRAGVPWNRPATLMFSVMLHELGHIKAPLIYLDTPEQLIDIRDNRVIKIQANQGLRGFSVEDGKELGPDVCPVTLYRQTLDEAIIEDSARRMVTKLGLEPEGTGYDNEVNLYRGKVLTLFPEGHRYLLDMQAETQKEDFFRALGQRLGHSSDRQYVEGYRFLFPNTIPA